MHGHVVICNTQTDGRGQQGSIWQSAPNSNLTFSIVLQPSFLEINQQFRLNLVVTVAIHDALKGILGEYLSVKWSNDILYRNKKLGGILIENTLQGNYIKNSIIGIGINVNQEKFENITAISMAMIQKNVYDLNEIFNKLLLHIEKRYLQLETGHYQTLKADYLHALYKYQEKHDFQLLTPRTGLSPIFNGDILGIDDVGRLAIQVQDKIHYFSTKEIKFLL